MTFHVLVFPVSLSTQQPSFLFFFPWNSDHNYYLERMSIILTSGLRSEVMGFYAAWIIPPPSCLHVPPPLSCPIYQGIVSMYLLSCLHALPPLSCPHVPRNFILVQIYNDHLFLEWKKTRVFHVSCLIDSHLCLGQLRTIHQLHPKKQWKLTAAAVQPIFLQHQVWNEWWFS